MLNLARPFPMSTDNTEQVKKLLKKLRKKADLSRYCHSELKERCRMWRNCKEFMIILLSISSTLLIGFNYRGLITGEIISALIFILPSLVIAIQTLDSTLFRWADKVAEHETAVQVWGSWIREADFIEKQLCQSKVESESLGIKNIQEKYNNCMTGTPQIPNSKFLTYKMNFKEHVLKSKMIDSMDLDDIEAEK